jgi:hypothetical protein
MVLLSTRGLVALGLAGALVLGACGSSKEPAAEERARIEREVAADVARMRELSARVSAEGDELKKTEVTKELEGLSRSMKTLDDRLSAATDQLAAAKTPEDRERIAARLAAIGRDKAELQQRIDELRASLDRK